MEEKISNTFLSIIKQYWSIFLYTGFLAVLGFAAYSVPGGIIGAIVGFKIGHKLHNKK